MTNFVRIKLRKSIKQIDADAGDLELSEHDRVVVETGAGPIVGTVVPHVGHVCARLLTDKKLPKVLRMAESDDIRQEELNIRMERDYFQICLKKIDKHNLPMKLVDVEIVPDGSKVVFFFVSESRVDFRALVKELAADLRTRIEMRQIGARSEAQNIGGIGCCGRELCCTMFLKKFCPVTVKMTKEQGLPLDPEKISGVCGRLMCCLSYEFDTYVEMKKGLPKIGKKINTPQGIGRIRQINVLSKKITLEMEDGVTADMNIDEYTPDMLIKPNQQ